MEWLMPLASPGPFVPGAFIGAMMTMILAGALVWLSRRPALYLLAGIGLATGLILLAADLLFLIRAGSRDLAVLAILAVALAIADVVRGVFLLKHRPPS